MELILNPFLAITLISSFLYLLFHICILKKPNLANFDTSEHIEILSRGAAFVVSVMFLAYLCLPVLIYALPEHADFLASTLEPSDEQILGAILVASFYGFFEGLKPFFKKET